MRRSSGTLLNVGARKRFPQAMFYFAHQRERHAERLLVGAWPSAAFNRRRLLYEREQDGKSNTKLRVNENFSYTTAVGSTCQVILTHSRRHQR